MKNELKISTISILCVLCTMGFTPAYGAASVRSLGGAGTYNSAASASSGGAAGGATTGVARAGSMRVTAGSGKTGTATSVAAPSATSTRTATSPRLSLGKYLGGATTISGGSSVRPTNPSTPGASSTVTDAAFEALQGQVDALEKQTGVWNAKQDKLGGSTYIDVDQASGTVSLDFDAVAAALTGNDGRDVDFKVVDDDAIYWGYVEDSGNVATWTKLIDLDKLRGAQGAQGIQGPAGADGRDAVVDYTKIYNDLKDAGVFLTDADLTQINDNIAETLKGYVTKTALAETLAEYPTNTELQAKLQEKADVTAVESLTGDTSTLASSITALQSKDTELATEIAKKADATALAATDAKVTENTAAIALKADKSALEAVSGDAAAVQAALDAKADATALAATDAKVTENTAAIALKADKTALDDYTKTEDLADVAISGDYDDLNNKPVLATVATTGKYGDLQEKPTIPAAQVNADWNATDGVAKILNKPTLAAVATSGDYGDLENAPTIPAAQVNADWDATSGVAEILNKPTLATVAKTGSYGDLENKPTIPAAQVNADWNATEGVAEILNKPDMSVYATTSAVEAGFEVVDAQIALRAKTADLAEVATTGSYDDLTNKPNIPDGVVVDLALSKTSENAVANKAVVGGLDAKLAFPDSADSAVMNQSGKPYVLMIQGGEQLWVEVVDTPTSTSVGG